MTNSRKKIGVLIVAYNAATTLPQVLDAFPSDVLALLDEIFVFDDASADETYAVVQDYKARKGFEKLRVFKNARNLGYGGNQKAGFDYAITHGFDYVVLMHGDGQHDPQALPALLAPILQGKADIVFGSRMLRPREALKGGMPLYKFIGNKILTWFENKVLGTHMSEFHSGYRVYSCAALAQIPYRINADGFHFDSEIIIQLHELGLPILEIAMPTIYANEICRVNGMKYCLDIIRMIIAFALHRRGIIYRSRFDLARASPPPPSPHTTSPHPPPSATPGRA
jgi:glycosyltransferase involved in cell wall biosynthesis